VEFGEVSKAADRLLDWLRTLQVPDSTTAVRGGLVDPVEDRVEPEQYAASHYFLGATLAAAAGYGTHMESGRLAGAFAIHNLVDRGGFGHKGHFDFNNFAIAEALGTAAGAKMPLEWQQCLTRANRNAHRTVNWCAMRSYYFLWRARQTGSAKDRVRGLTLLYAVLGRQRSDGMFEEHVGSVSLQYHAYTAAVLCRIGEVFDLPVCLGAARSACVALQSLTTPDGEWAYYGRGQRQVFGQCAALFLLTFGHRRLGVHSLDTADAVWRRLASLQRSDGSLPLVLTPDADARRAGWYDYNRLSVYNAFAAVWLWRTALLLEGPAVQSRAVRNRLASLRADSGIRVLQSAQRRSFVAVGVGGGRYATECGIAPHMVWVSKSVVSCPGGSTSSQFGKVVPFEHLHDNYMVPLVWDGEKWGGATGRCRAEMPHGTVYSGTCKAYAIRRRWSVDADVRIVDEIRLRKPCAPTEVRLANLPLLVSAEDRVVLGGSAISIDSGRGRIIVRVLASTPTILKYLGKFAWAAGPVTLYALFPIEPLMVGASVTVETHIRYVDDVGT
jgi:hypothetical protein